MLLIVMNEAGTWHAEPGQTVTFGRGQECTIKLPAGDRGLSRSAGSLSFHDGAWWLRNDSSSSMLYLSGDRGFQVDLPPGMQIPVQQWHAKVRLQGVFNSYTLRLRLPDLDGPPDEDGQPGRASLKPVPPSASGAGEPAVTSTRFHARSPILTGWSWRPGSSSTSVGGTAAPPRRGRRKTPPSGSGGNHIR